MVRRLHLVFCTLILATGSAAGAQGAVHVVDDDGTAPFTTIAAAIAAASPGDVVLVKDGVYGGFLLDGRSLSVVADAGATVVVEGGVRVANTAKTQVVLLHGLTVDAEGSSVPVEVESCAGTLFVQSCVLNGSSDLDASDGGGAMVVRSSDHVAVVGCTLLGGSPAAPATVLEGGAGLAVLDDSNAQVYDCFLRGGDGAPTGPGGSGALVDDESFVFLSNTTVLGGDGGAGTAACFDAGSGGHALTVDGASTQVRLLDCIGIGGSGGAPGGASCPGGSPGGPVDVKAGLVGLVPGSARVMTANNPVRDGETLDFSFEGEPGDTVLAAWSLYPDLAFSPFFQGGLVVPTNLVYKPKTIGVQPTSGPLTASYPIDPFKGDGSFHMVVQQFSVTTSPVLDVRVGSGFAVVLLDSAF